jgi:hypothetical protein
MMYDRFDMSHTPTSRKVERAAYITNILPI